MDLTLFLSRRSIVIESIVVCVLTFIAFKFLQLYRHVQKQLRIFGNMPGPPRHWLYGNMHLLPQSWHERLQVGLELSNTYQPLYPFWVTFFSPVLVVSHASTVKEILKTTDFGEESLLTLTRHYEKILEDAGVEAAESVLEWSSLKSLLYARFDPSPAIHLWNINGTRRPLFADSNTRQAMRTARRENVEQITAECGEAAAAAEIHVPVSTVFNDGSDSESEDSGFDTDEDDFDEDTVMKTMINEGLL